MMAFQIQSARLPTTTTAIQLELFTYDNLLSTMLLA